MSDLQDILARDGYNIIRDLLTRVQELEVRETLSGSATAFLGLIDTPGTYAGQPNYLVEVNGATTGLDFTNAPTIPDFTNANHDHSDVTNGGTLDLSDLTGDLDDIADGATYVRITAVNHLDLTDGGDSSLHYHASDRNRANHTGTQLKSTISDFAHSLTGAEQTIGGSTYDLVGNNGGSPALLTPLYDASGGLTGILRSNAGLLKLDHLILATWLGIDFTTPTNKVTIGGEDDNVFGTATVEIKADTTPGIKIWREGETAINLVSYGNITTIKGRRASGTQASPTAVAANDILMRFGGAGYNGSSWSGANRALIDFIASENWSSGNEGSYVSIRATANGSASSSEVMVLLGNGRIGIGASNPSAMTHIDQSSTTAAIPVLYLDQADVSEQMIHFESTIGTGNAIEAVGSKTLTVTHFIKVTLTGGLVRYLPVGTIA